MDLAIVPPSHSDSPTAVVVGSYQRSLKGEDSLKVKQCQLAGEELTFFMVADGHGGHHVSTFAAAKMLDLICDALVKREPTADALQDVISNAFLGLNSEVCSDTFDAGANAAGSTLTVCCINATRGEIHCWNVGDSLALVVHDRGHRLADNLAEQARVVATGATLGRAMNEQGQPGGPMRAFPGGLAVTRVIGDADCASFVTATPSHDMRMAPAGGGAIIVCSDGVWDHLSAEQVAAVLMEGKYKSAKAAAELLVRKSTKKGLTDDTTAIVCLFGPLSSPVDSNADMEHSKDSNDMDSSKDSTKEAEDELDEVEPPPADEPKMGFLAARLPPLDNRTASPAVARREQTAMNNPSVKMLRPPSAQGGSAEGKGDAAAEVPVWSHNFSPAGSRFGGGSDRSSVRVEDDAEFEATTPEPPSLPPLPSPTERSSGKRRSLAGAMLSGLFDASIRRHTSSSISSENSMDVSKMPPSPEMRRSADGASEQRRSVDSAERAKASTDSDGSFGKSRGLKPLAKLPWRGCPSNRSIVNTEPEQGWTKTRSPVKAQRRSSKRRPSNDEEEASLRTSLGSSAAKANTVDWAALDANMKFLGQGEFATAHRTSLDGQSVAVKMLKKSKQESPPALKGIKREIMLMTLMKHPNVLHTHALGLHEGKPFIVVELLSSVLAAELPRDVDTVPFWVHWREKKRWPISRCVHCGLQLARALKYCHDDAFPGCKILHRDVKPNNIGFRADGDLVLFDFGLASLWRTDSEAGQPEDAPRNLTGETGSMRYMAPEVANSQPYSHKAEVFSFATVLWELCAHKKPFLAYSDPNLFKKAIGNGVLPTVAPSWPAELKQLFADCWQLEQSKRPEFRELLPRLDTLTTAELAATAPQGGFATRPTPAPPSPDESPGLLALFCGRKSPKSPKASPRKFSQTGQGMVVSEPSGDRATG